MKTIMIIGAGFLQTPVIKKAKKLGYRTISVDRDENAEGFIHSDSYKATDIVDQDACLEYAKKMKIDGVLTAATDFGVITASYIAKEMNLPGLNYETAQRVKNKYKVRQILFENRIDDVSQYYEIDNIEQLEGVKDSIHFPVMVKPCDGSGSKGARRVDAIGDLKSACSMAIEASLIGKALIEDFIEGSEYGVESFVLNGEVYVLGIMKKIMTEPPIYAELGHAMPSGLTNELKKRITEITKLAIKALGINHGAVNMDLLITEKEQIFLVDIGARMGGNIIGSHIIPLGTGIDYMKILIKVAMGEKINIEAEHPAKHVATRLLALNPGKVTGLPDFDAIKKKHQVDIFHHLKVGDIIREYQNNLDGFGYVVATTDDIETAELNAEKAKQLVDKSIIRG